MQGHFASLWKIIDEKDHPFPNFTLIIEIKKYPFFVPTPNRLPPPSPLTPQTLLKRQIGP